MVLCDVLSLLILNVFDLYIVIEYVRTRFSSRIWITLASVYQTYNRFVKSSQWAPRWTSTCQYWRKRVGQVNAVKLYAFLQSSAPWCTLKAECSANSCAVVLMPDVHGSLNIFRIRNSRVGDWHVTSASFSNVNCIGKGQTNSKST